MEYLDLTKKQKVEIAKKMLESGGYVFEHPTLVLEGRDGWLVILTPSRAPYQAIVHIDKENKPDFWSTIPELIE